MTRICSVRLYIRRVLNFYLWARRRRLCVSRPVFLWRGTYGYHRQRQRIIWGLFRQP